MAYFGFFPKKKRGLSMSDDLVARGSRTAKNGFRNEKDVIDKFNNWKTDLR